MDQPELSSGGDSLDSSGEEECSESIKNRELEEELQANLAPQLAAEPEALSLDTVCETQFIASSPPDSPPPSDYQRQQLRRETMY